MKKEKLLNQLAKDLFQKKQDDLKAQGKDYMPDQDMTAEEIEKEQEEGDWLDERRETCVDKPILKLVGETGNAFAILGMASRVARKNNMDWDKISKEAMSGDYDNLLQVMCKYFDVE
jgi:hypothetical protein